MNRMKAEGHRACANIIKTTGVDAARSLAHALVLDAKGRMHIDPYAQGFINEFNKSVKPLDSIIRK